MCALERSTIELPEPPPAIDIPPELPPETDGRNKAMIWVAVIAAVLVVAALLLFAVNRSRKASPSSQTIARVERGSFVRVLRLKGTTEAVQSRTITAPMLAGALVNNLVITRLAHAGAKVKRGDLLVEFDRQTQIKNALDKQAEYQTFASQVSENQAQENAARAKDETELKQAEDELKKDDLEMRRNEILSRIDAEKNQENLEQAKANLLQLHQTFDLKRRSAQAAIRILELKRDKSHEDMLHAQLNADQMQIRSPIDGVISLHSIWKQETLSQVQEGDQVRAGEPVMDVVDPSVMQVQVQANQQDVADLRLGQPAQVRLDAYPEIVFTSKLEELAPLGLPGNLSEKVHSFAALFSVTGNNPKLMPDLSAALDVELERRDNVLIAPRESVIRDGQDEYVWLKTSLGFHKQRITTGAANDTQVVIQSGLSDGDVLQRRADRAQTQSD